MRIDSNQTAPSLPETGQSGRSSNAGASSRETQVSVGGALGEDSAQLSGAHVQVQALVEQALQFPEVRQEKVDALRQSVLSGSYQPTSKQVAEAVFAHLAT
jgi:negative regulator of flagellin synthesis FlgM